MVNRRITTHDPKEAKRLREEERKGRKTSRTQNWAARRAAGTIPGLVKPVEEKKNKETEGAGPLE